MNITEARDEMIRRHLRASDELHGAFLVMEGMPIPWPDAIEANWQRMGRRCDRRWAAWRRLAAAASRSPDESTTDSRDSQHVHNR